MLVHLGQWHLDVHEMQISNGTQAEKSLDALLIDRSRKYVDGVTCLSKMRRPIPTISGLGPVVREACESG
jgi:hypothetical protein